MRVIKFKAWDQAKKQFVGEFSYWDFGIMLGSKSDNIRDFIPLQFTGFKDKNGKEIYEGDILLIDAGKYENRYVVKYGVGEFDSGIYKYVGFYLQDKEYQAEHTWWVDQLDRVEGIGNLYENPELLNGTIEANKKTGLPDKGE